ncbi:hypothetical protein D3C74_191330 [compost metagenome]
MTKKEVTLRKITEKPELLDVEGQGCWTDCFIAGHYVNQRDTAQQGCYYVKEEHTPFNSIFS